MNATELVTAVRISGLISPTDPVFTDAVVRDLLTQSVYNKFADPVTRLRQGYWLQRQYVATDSNVQGLYRLPKRAVVQGLENLEISEDNGANWRPLNIATQPQATDLQSLGSYPSHYTLEADCVRIFPVPNSNYLLRFTYYVRPPVLSTFAATCLVASVSTNAVTTSTDPTTVGITSPATGIDIQNADGSHELALVGEPAVQTGPSLGVYTLTFSNTRVDTTRVRIGDVIRPADVCVYPMIPRELHQALADYTAAIIWQMKGDFEKAGELASKAENQINRVVSMAQPRIKSAPFKWKRRNSFLRRNLGWW